MPTTRGVHELLTRDINAPLPTVFNSQGEAIGPRPFGAAAGDIYQYEGTGVFRQNQLIVFGQCQSQPKTDAVRILRFSQRHERHGWASRRCPRILTICGEDYGRAAFDIRHRAFISATTTLPFGIRMAPFIFMQSGMPYNVTSGVDTNSDGNPNDDRPAFAQNLSRPSVINDSVRRFRYRARDASECGHCSAQLSGRPGHPVVERSREPKLVLRRVGTRRRQYRRQR